MSLSEWVENLRNKICDEEDQSLFNESVGCAENGFFRAGYLIAWVSIVESLKKKILESANLGDSQAESLNDKILNEELKKNSVDTLILNSALELKLIDEHDESKLKFLWEQRCIFAHPYLKAPSIDDLKYIINTAVELCLSKPLVYRKNYINNFINDLLTIPYFLTDNYDENIIYSRKVITRVSVDLHPYFFKKLLAALGTIILDDAMYKTKIKCRIFILEILKLDSSDLTNNIWSLEHRAINYPYTCIWGIVDSFVWGKLTCRVKDLLIEYAIIENDETKTILIKRIICQLWKDEKLEVRYRDLFIKYLDSIDFKFAYSYYGDRASLYDRIITEFSSGVFTKQNEVADFLRKSQGLDFIKGIDITEQITLGIKLMSCARENSWTSQYFIEDLKNGKETTFGLMLGIFQGTLIPSEKYFSLDCKYFIKVLMIINTLEDEEISYVFDYIIKVIEDYDAFSVFNKDDIDKIDIGKLTIKSLTYTKSVQLMDCLYKYSI